MSFATFKRLSGRAVLALALCAILGSGCDMMHKGSTTKEAMASTAKDTIVLHNNHGIVGVYTMSADGSLLSDTSEAGAAKCAECEADMKAYYMTGKIDPVCKVCGAKRVILSPTSTRGH